MPRNNHHHHHHQHEMERFSPDPPFPTGGFRHHTSSSPSSSSSSKRNPRFLYLLLQTLIMAFIISLFFIFIGVAAIIFIHLCIAGGALHRRHRRINHRHQQPISGDSNSPSGYSSDELKTLPKSRFTGCEICSICLEYVKEGDICRVLPKCKHVFHLNCVDKWLVKVPLCPVCRCCVRSLDMEGKRIDGFDWEHLWATCG